MFLSFVSLFSLFCFLGSGWFSMDAALIVDGKVFTFVPSLKQVGPNSIAIGSKDCGGICY